MIEYNVEQEDINKIIEQEKKERLCNNKLKCLEVSIKMLNYHLERNEFEGLINTLKALSKKKQQSGFVILGVVKFSLKMFFPKVQAEESLLKKYLEVLKGIFNNIKVKSDENFDLLKKNLMKSIDTENWDEIQHLVFNCEYGVEDVITIDKHINKNISLGDTCHFNTESSTKLDNKLEISINKENLTSTRNLNIISPVSKVGLQRNYTSSSSLKVLQNDHIKFTKINKVKLPYLYLAVDITMSALQIKKLFISEMNNLKIIVRGDERSDLIFAEKREVQILQSLLECFHIGRRSQEPNAIQFSIKYSDNKYERIIELKAISGKKEICEQIITAFVKSLVKKVKKIRVVRKSENFNIDHFIRESNIQKIKNNPINGCSYTSLTEEESVVDSSNREASNFYEFYRILSQDNYDLGKSVRDFVEHFKHTYKNIDDSINLIPRQMEEIVKFVDECVSTFHCYFNFGKSNTEKMLPYCRPAVEKFIFNKLYFLLYDIYNHKYDEENKEFLSNQNNIKVKKSVYEIMEFLEIKKKFRGIDSDDGILPYKSTIDCINKVEFEQTPKDKFDTLMKASLELRNGILDITKGKSELNSMDDELPLFIYLTTQINVKNILLELNMIEDYLQFSKSIDKESKVLTNLRSSVFYITNDWKGND